MDDLSKRHQLSAVGTIVIVAALLLSACGSHSLSYKDGVVAVDQSTQDGSSWAVNEASLGNSDNTACGILVGLMPQGDNRSDWIQGCIAQFDSEVGASKHPGAGG